MLTRYEVRARNPTITVLEKLARPFDVTESIASCDEQLNYVETATSASAAPACVAVPYALQQAAHVDQKSAKVQTRLDETKTPDTVMLLR
jgi:hypothetical protein